METNKAKSVKYSPEALLTKRDIVCRNCAGVSSKKCPLFCKGSRNFLGTTMKLIITKVLRKKMFYIIPYLMNITIKRQMVSFLNISQELVDTSSQNLIF